MAAIYEKTSILPSLTNLGLANIALLDDGHRFVSQYYEMLRGRRTPTHLGEIPLPPELSHLPTDSNLGIYYTFNGLGHVRIGMIFAHLAEILNIPHSLVNLSDDQAPVNHTLLGKIFATIYPRYIKESIKVGVARHLAPTSAIDQIHLPTTPMNQLLNFFERWYPESCQNLFMGKPDPKINLTQIKRTASWLKFLVGDQYQKFVDGQGITHHLSVFPFINALIDQVLTVGTDMVLEARGWHLFQRLLVASPEGAQKLREFWGEQYQHNAIVTHGFPAPLSAMYRRQEFICERAKEAEAYQPLFVVCPASGAAWAQAEVFKDGICELAPLLEKLNLCIIAHCGVGQVGEQVQTYIQSQLNHLDKNELSRIFTFFSPTHEGAVDFYEAIISNPVPMVIVTKGSEQACIALQLGIPLIITGTIGEHEKWNVIIGLRKGLPMALLPPAYQELSEFIQSQPFTPEERQELTALINQAQVQNIAEGIQCMREYVGRGIVPDVNVGMMTEALLKLFTV